MVPRTPGRSRGAAWVAGSVVVIGAGLGSAWAYTSSTPAGPSDDGPVMVVVERTARPSEPPHETTAPPPPPTKIEAPPPPEPPPGPDAVRDPSHATTHTPREAPIEAPFRARGAAIAQCFEAHGGDDPPEVVVRFELAADGSVTSASVLPDESSPLGSCLAGIARSTRFPARGEPVSFRVPLGARRRGE